MLRISAVFPVAPLQRGSAITFCLCSPLVVTLSNSKTAGCPSKCFAEQRASAIVIMYKVHSSVLCVPAALCSVSSLGCGRSPVLLIDWVISELQLEHEISSLFDYVLQDYISFLYGKSQYWFHTQYHLHNHNPVNASYWFFKNANHRKSIKYD